MVMGHIRIAFRTWAGAVSLVALAASGAGAQQVDPAPEPSPSEAPWGSAESEPDAAGRIEGVPQPGPGNQGVLGTPEVQEDIIRRPGYQEPGTASTGELVPTTPEAGGNVNQPTFQEDVIPADPEALPRAREPEAPETDAAPGDAESGAGAAVPDAGAETDVAPTQVPRGEPDRRFEAFEIPVPAPGFSEPERGAGRLEGGFGVEGEF